MNLIRKLVVFILACLITVNFISLSAFADVKGGKLEISDATAKVEDIIDINVKLSDNPGFVSANIYVNYDESVLSLENVTDGKILTGAAHSDNYSSPYGLCWMNDLATENIKANGVLVTLTFKVKESNKTDTSIAIEQDIVDYKLDNVIFEVSGGKIKLNSEDLPEQSSQSKSSDAQSEKNKDNSSAEKKNDDQSQSNHRQPNTTHEESGVIQNQNNKNKTDSTSENGKSDSSESGVANTQNDYTSISDQSEISSQSTKPSTKDTAIASASSNGELPIWTILGIILFLILIVAIAAFINKKRKNAIGREN